MVQNSCANTGDTSSIPGPGRFHMPWGNKACLPQLLKPVCPRACALQEEKPLEWEAHTPQQESRPRSLQLEKSCTQQQRPSAVKIIFFFKRYMQPLSYIMFPRRDLASDLKLLTSLHTCPSQYWPTYPEKQCTVWKSFHLTECKNSPNYIGFPVTLYDCFC